MANGVPIGACIPRGKPAETLDAGTHGSTFGGNPLACSAALAVLKTLQNENLPEQAGQRGQQIRDCLATRLSNNNQVVDIRNKGLMIGIELSRPCTELVTKALARGLLINVTGTTTIRLLPPLIIDNDQINLLVETLTTLIQEFTQ